MLRNTCVVKTQHKGLYSCGKLDQAHQWQLDRGVHYGYNDHIVGIRYSSSIQRQASGATNA